MNGEVEDWSLLAETLGLSSDHPALDSDEGDLYTDLFGVPKQANSEESSEPWNDGAWGIYPSDFVLDPEESPEPWNNGAPGFDVSGFGIDPQLKCPVGAGTTIPAQIVSDQGVAGAGSVDGSQVAIGAP